MNPPINNFIIHPFCSDRIEKFCRELEQADIHQKLPLPKKLTFEEKEIIYVLLNSGYIAYYPNDPDHITKCTCYPFAVETAYSCMYKGNDLNKDPDFYISLIADCGYNIEIFAQIFIDALYVQNTLWIVNNLIPLFEYIDNNLFTDSIQTVDTLDDYLFNSLIPMTIYSYLQPDTCTDPAFKKPAESQRKQFLSNISFPNPVLFRHSPDQDLNRTIMLLKYLFGISDAYLYFDIAHPILDINSLFEMYFSKFNITSFPSFVPRFKQLIDFLSIDNTSNFDFKMNYLTFPWWTAEIIAHLSQYQSVFDNIPACFETIQYLLQNNASEKALELLKMKFLNTDEYPLLLNDICSESSNIPAEDKTQIMNFLLKYIPESSRC